MNTLRKEEINFYKKMQVNPPRMSASERQLRRSIHRNFFNLYARKCSATNENIISMYNENVLFPVYSNKYWWSDKWDSKQINQDYNLNLSLFKNYSLLKNRVPHLATFNHNSENCNFGNAIMSSKDCYLVFGCVRNENCMYGHIVWECENTFDCVYAFSSQWCSNSVDIVGCYDVHFSQESTNCRESYFLYDCRNCNNCFCCFNLRSKKYCIFNKQYSKEHYYKEIKKLLPLHNKNIRKYNSLLEKQDKIMPNFYQSQSENVTGNHAYFSNNCEYSFDIKRCEDSAYCFTVLEAQNCHDMSFVGGPNRFCFQCLTTSNCENTICSHCTINCSNTAYSEFCHNCSDIIACNGLRNAKYCILNKQYSKEEYFILKEKIMNNNNWGEFFKESPFAFNESIAFEYFDLRKEEILKKGYKWKDEIEKTRCEINYVEKIDLNKVYNCEQTNKKYKYTKKEVEFYNKMSLPIPEGSYIARHRHLMQKRNKRILIDGECEECKNKISKFSEEKSYCLNCYNNFLV